MQAGVGTARAGVGTLRAGQGWDRYGACRGGHGVGRGGHAAGRFAAQTFLDGAGQRFCSSPNSAALCGRGQRRQAAASAAPRSHARAQGGSFSSFVCGRPGSSRCAAAPEQPGKGLGRSRGARRPRSPLPRHSHRPGLAAPGASSDPGGAELFMTGTRPGSGDGSCARGRGGRQQWGQGQQRPVPTPGARRRPWGTA